MAILIGLLGLAGVARAQVTVIQWNVAGSGTWNTAGNWSPANVPNTTSEEASFNLGAGGTISVTGNLTVRGIVFGTSAGSYTISRSGANRTLTLGGTGAPGYITNNDDSTQTLTGPNLRLTLGAAATFTVAGAGDLVISTTNTIATTATNTLTLTGDGSGTGSISAVIAGTGGQVIKSGLGTWVLSGANTYTGATTINNGTLIAASNAALGTTAGSTTVNSGGTLGLQGGITTAEALSIQGAGAGSAGAIRNVSGSNTLTGAITLANDATVGSDAGTLTMSGNFTGTNRALVFTGAGNTSVSGVINTGSGTLTKNGSGTLTLTGANVYSGGTTLSAGTLAVGNNSALGSGTLTLNAGTLSASGGARSLSNAATIGGDFTIGGANDLTLAGNINLGGGTRTVTVDNTGTTTFSGIIGEPWYSSLVKAGDGRLVLSGTNTFSGFVEVNNGTLAITNSNALGAAGTWNNVVADGATLELSSDINVSEGGFTITGSGDGGVGAIRNLSGNNTLAGQLALGGATTINSTAGSLTLSSYTDLGANALTVAGAGNVTFNAQIAGSGGSLTKQDGGTLTLAGSNSYTGATTISGGTLVAANNTALGDNTGSTTVASGATLALQNNISSAESINAQGAGVGGGGAIRNLSGDNTLSSAVTLANNTTVASDAGSLTFSGGISGTNRDLVVAGAGNTTISSTINTGTGALTKEGAGTLTLTAANSFSGNTTVNAGTLNLQNNTAAGSGSIYVGPSSTLQVQGGNVYIANDITLAGGILQSVSGDNNQFGGDIFVTAGSTIRSSTAAQTLVVGDFPDFFNPVTTTLSLGSNTLTVDGAGNTTFYANIGESGDTGGFVSNSTGTVRFYGYTNYYEGNTTINSGTLLIDTDPNSFYNNQTIRGNLTIGDGVSAALVKFSDDTGNNRIADTSTITINSGSTLDLNSNFDTVGGLNLTGASITLGDFGTLQLTGDVTVNAGTSTITGYQFSMTTDNSARAFDIASGGVLDISSQVTTGSLVKNGFGTMILSGSNIYTGATTINAGIIDARSNNALGSTIGGTTVASGAELRLNNVSNLTVTGEALTLSGTGFSIDPVNSPASTGALRNVAGNNTWTGNISLGANARINSDSGTLLTLSGGLTLAGKNLTVGGEGDTTISGVISNGVGTGTLSKDGNGTLTLTGNNNYSGFTTISDGVVNIRHGDALGSTAAGTSVASGAALQMQGGITTGAEALTLNGTGVSNDGALRNISGDNTYGGAITIASATSRINSDAGTLTLSNTVDVASNTLTVGGALNTTITGQLTGSNASTLEKDGAGTLTLSNSTNTFSGNVDINTGTLAFGANNALNNSNIDVSIDSGATMSLVQYAQTIGTLAGLGAVDFGTGGSLTLLGNTTFSGSFAGTGTIIVGAGVTLTLGADFNAAGVTIQLAGGTLDVNGSDSVFAGLTLTGNSIIDFDSGADSTIQFTTLSLGGYGLEVHGWVDTQDYFLVTNQPGTIGQPPLNQVTFGPSGGPPWTGANTTWQPWDNQVTPITPVPEPSTYGAMLMAAGLGLFGFRRWRQTRANATK